MTDGNYNMLTKVIDDNGVPEVTDSNEAFTYDGMGRLLTAGKKEGASWVSLTTLAYNAIGKVTSNQEELFGGSAKTASYTYDQAGYPDTVAYPDGSTTISIDTDWQGRLDTIKQSGATLVSYQYIGSQVAQRKYEVPSPDVVYQPTYDNFGRITSADSGASYAKFNYTYESNSDNIAKQVYDHRTDDPNLAFTYDDLDRLTNVSYGMDSTSESFTYDDLGNRDSATLRDTTTDDYVIDANNNRYASVDGNSMTYNAAGGLTTDKDDYDFEYDYENRITKIEDANSATVAEFAYDALGRRIKKIDSKASVTTLYYHNTNWQVLAETNSGGTTQRWFIYGNYIDEPLRMTDVGSGDSYYYVHDHLYSPVALVDEDGDVVERYEYDAYGNARVYDASYGSRSSSLYDNPYLFTGRRVDMLDSGNLAVMYYRLRSFDPDTGRFMQTDPIGYLAGSMNLYEYVESRPINLIDPFGASPRDQLIAQTARYRQSCERFERDCDDDPCPGGEPNPACARAIRCWQRYGIMKQQDDKLTLIDWEMIDSAIESIEEGEVGDYLGDVTETMIGLGQGVGDVGVGTYETVRHPMQTAKGVGHSIAHPINTASRMGQGLRDNANTLIGDDPRASGRVIGHAAGNAAVIAVTYKTVGGIRGARTRFGVRKLTGGSKDVVTRRMLVDTRKGAGYQIHRAHKSGAHGTRGAHIQKMTVRPHPTKPGTWKVIRRNVKTWEIWPWN